MGTDSFLSTSLHERSHYKVNVLAWEKYAVLLAL